MCKYVVTFDAIVAELSNMKVEGSLGVLQQNLAERRRSALRGASGSPFFPVVGMAVWYRAAVPRSLSPLTCCFVASACSGAKGP